MLRSLLLLTLLAIAPVYGPCSKKRPTPIPDPTPTAQPTPEPSIEPVPSPIPSPTATPIGRPPAYPVPAVNLAPYLHEQGGQVVVVDTSGVEDVGAVVNAADAFDGPGKLVVKGGGQLKIQLDISHDIDLTDGVYSLDAETLEGQILLRDNVKLECRNATLLEPTFFDGTAAITAIQAYYPAKNNYAKAEGITVRGCRIIGRQEKTDGGVRQSISFGNCKNCAAIENDLSGIASIGIQFGGGAAQGNHAENVLAYRNKLRRFAAAAIAGVNVKGFTATENDIRDPGRRRGEPGGISGIDIESNNTDDCVKDIRITDNYIGYGNAPSGSIGNGILGQNVYGTPCSGGLLVANNVIDGWEGRNGLEASNNWGLSGGLYFVGRWDGGLVVSNTVIRALQPGFSFYGVRGLTFRDVWFISSGGGGMGAGYLEGSLDNTFERVRIFDDPAIKPGSTGWWIQCDETSGVNVFRDIQLEGGILCKR